MTLRRPFHGTAILYNKKSDIAGGSKPVFETPVSHRIMHVRHENVNYINIYAPCVKAGPEAQEELSSFLGDLDDILSAMEGDTNIVCGDFNLSEKHSKERKRLFNNLFEKHKIITCKKSKMENM